ncbi:MAG: mechanosensitive ion channel [Bryobacteraceae bacterium]
MFRILLTAVSLALILPAQTPSPTPDPLGRNSPRATVIGFLQAAQRDRLRVAAEYLEMTEADRNARGARMAQQLRAVFDNAYRGSLDTISIRPEGALDDGLPADREEIVLDAHGATASVLGLVRTPGGAWLISSETVARIPDLYSHIAYPAVEEHLPEVLVRQSFLSMPLWQWLTALLFIPVALGAGWISARLLMGPLRAVLRRIRGGSSGETNLWWRNSVGAPMAAIFAMLAHLLFVNTLGVPLLYRYYYLRIVIVSLLVAVGWLLWRLVDHGFRRGVENARAAGRGSAASLLLLGRRILKALLLLVIGIAILAALGFQTSGILTGLGIGGIAIALAAQKTIENLFGGVSLVTDEVFRVGDVCKLGDRVGTIEDIGLRSTRLRTKERSELSIPNGALAAMNIENLTHRDKILMEKSIWLRVESTPAQLRLVLERSRALIEAHPKLAHPDSRIRLASIEETGHKLEIFAFVETKDFVEYLGVQEEILLRVSEYVLEAGTNLASRHSGNRSSAPIPDLD